MTTQSDLNDVQEDVATIKETLKWHKWLLAALFAAVVSPKVGGPDATTVASVASYLFS